MKIRHLRNATTLLTLGAHRLLVDPMLAAPGLFPGFKHLAHRVGGDILFSVEELVALVRRAPGRVVLNHLEALDHCPTTREGLRERMKAEGLLEKVLVPEDGEELRFERPDTLPHPRPRAMGSVWAR